MEVFKKLAIKLYDKILQACEGFTLWTNDYWKYFVTYHPSGTCNMFPMISWFDWRNDVLDPQLKGVRNSATSEVADAASIISYIVSEISNVSMVNQINTFNFHEHISIFLLQILIREKESDLIVSLWTTRRDNAAESIKWGPSSDMIPRIIYCHCGPPWHDDS